MPLGFRVWRVLTKSVKFNAKKKPDDPTIAELISFVRERLHNADELRKRSLYPGRSLDLELALSIPATWSRVTGEDWVEKALLARATDIHVTLRERGTAAHGLWQRALAQPSDLPRIQKIIQDLIDQCLDPDGQREDIAAGRRWLAATLKQAITKPEPVCNAWPENEEPWYKTVMQLAAEIEHESTIREDLRPATRTLFEHALLQNAGVPRRQAIDALVVAGWAKQITGKMAKLLEKETGESWLRIRALFALGFMQDRSGTVQRALGQACQHAFYRLVACHDAHKVPSTSLVNEMHAALFAIGDCFGVRGAETEAQRIRSSLEDMLRELVSPMTHPEALWPIARAAGYLLTVTAQPSQPGQSEDLSERLLTTLKDHRGPDQQESGRRARTPASQAALGITRAASPCCASTSLMWGARADDYGRHAHGRDGGSPGIQMLGQAAVGVKEDESPPIKLCHEQRRKGGQRVGPETGGIGVDDIVARDAHQELDRVES